MKQRWIWGIALLAGLVVAALVWQPWQQPAGPQAVVLSSAGAVLIVDTHGTQRTLVAADGATRFQLTPAPDGAHVAYLEAVGRTVRLQVQALDGTVARTLHETSAERPFYMAWSPDSRSIAFLASDAEMHLMLVAADGSGPAREIRAGQPSYFAWTPDSTRLLMHIGGGVPNGHLLEHDVNTATTTTLDAAPGDFQTPAWDAQGSTRYVVVFDGTANQLIAITDGQRSDLAIRSADAIVFSPAPDRSQIAYLTVGPQGYSPIHVLNLERGTTSVIPSLPPIAFFWSPDGTRLATIMLEPRGIGPSADAGAVAQVQQSLPQVHWEVTDLATNSTATFAPFTPSEDFVNLLPYFDQYATSLHLWSPDGTRLIYGANDGVWSLDIVAGKATRLSDGSQGFWVPTEPQ